MDAETDLDDGVGSPGPEAMANGMAAIGAALLREAHAIAATGAALRQALVPVPVPAWPAARERLITDSAGDAALHAALLLTAAAILAEGGPAAHLATRIAAAAREVDFPPAGLAAALRMAALAPPTDDGAARIAAAAIAQDLAVRLGSR